MDEAKSSRSGRCVCGACAYEVPLEPLTIFHCHCRFCQRSTGGPAFVEWIFRDKDFRLKSGDIKTYTHISEGSGKELTIHACARCLTKLYLRTARFPGFTVVYALTIDDDDQRPSPKAQPYYLFTDFAAPGTVIPSGVATFPEHRFALDGSENTPVIFDTPYTIP